MTDTKAVNTPTTPELETTTADTTPEATNTTPETANSADANKSIEDKIKSQSASSKEEAPKAKETAKEQAPETNPKVVSEKNRSKVAMERERFNVAREKAIEILSNPEKAEKFKKRKSFSFEFVWVSGSVRIQDPRVWVVHLSKENPKFETENAEIAFELLTTKKFEVK